jgi:hypothetical protein
MKFGDFYDRLFFSDLGVASFLTPVNGRTLPL